MKAFAIALFLLFSITVQDSWAVSPENCDTTEPLAGKVLDLINKGRRDGYLFQLLRVADAHLDKTESRAVYYLVLDVKESDCSVLSRKHWDDCKPDVSQRPSEIVIGQCKVIATTHSTDYQHLRVKNFNCTTSSVSSALTNTKDSPVFLDFFEDTHLYREQADKALEKFKGENADFARFRVDQVERVAQARGGEGTKYYVDFSVRNCSGYHFPRHFNAFGFCRADLSYNVEASDLESPIDIVINCEVFNLEEHRNTSGMHRLWGHKHHPPGQSPFKHNGYRNHHHFHKSHKPRPFHNHSSSGHSPHGHGPHGHGPHGHGPPGHGPLEHSSHGHGPHGHGPHGHGPPGHGTHGHGSHGHGSHGHGPHRHHSHGHHGRRPHHRPHGPHFHDFGPCDPPPHPPGHGSPPPSHGPPPPGQSTPPPGHGTPPPDHGPPPRHSEERGPDKGQFLFESRQTGYVYRLPPLEISEVLPSPEANFPIFSMPNHNPQKPEIQPFPQSVSESCPGKFKSEFPQVSKFFGYKSPK